MSMINRVRAGLLLLPFLASFAGAAPQESGDIMARVDEAVRTEMLRQKVPGVALGIVRKGKVIAAKGYGNANVELSVPVTAETIFQSGSVGKQFTATAVMLQEIGRAHV